MSFLRIPVLLFPYCAVCVSVLCSAQHTDADDSGHAAAVKWESPALRGKIAPVSAPDIPRQEGSEEVSLEDAGEVAKLEDVVLEDVLLADAAEAPRQGPSPHAASAEVEHQPDSANHGDDASRDGTYSPRYAPPNDRSHLRLGITCEGMMRLLEKLGLVWHLAERGVVH